MSRQRQAKKKVSRRRAKRSEGGLPEWIYQLSDGDDSLLDLLLEAWLAGQKAYTVVRERGDEVLRTCGDELEAADGILDAIRTGRVPRSQFAKKAEQAVKRFHTAVKLARLCAVDICGLTADAERTVGCVQDVPALIDPYASKTVVSRRLARRLGDAYLMKVPLEGRMVPSKLTAIRLHVPGCREQPIVVAGERSPPHVPDAMVLMFASCSKPNGKKLSETIIGSEVHPAAHVYVPPLLELLVVVPLLVEELLLVEEVELAVPELLLPADAPPLLEDEVDPVVVPEPLPRARPRAGATGATGAGSIVRSIRPPVSGSGDVLEAPDVRAGGSKRAGQYPTQDPAGHHVASKGLLMVW